MSDLNDAFWRKPKLHRREVAEQQLARLNTAPAPDHPEVAARKEREAAEALARHDERFANGFVQIEGAPYPVSRALARRLGFDVDPPGTAYWVGDEAAD